jgi:hypothetical protein
MSKARNLANLLADGAVGASELASTLDLSGKTLTLPEGVGGGVTTDSEANRPASPAVGTLFFNTTQDTLQQFTAQGWQDVGLDPFSISSVTGNIVNGVPTSLTIAGSNFGVSATVRFTHGVSSTDVAVTPASSTSINVAVPSGAYGSTVGSSIQIVVLQNNRVSNQLNKIVASVPTGGSASLSGNTYTHVFLNSSSFVVPTGLSISADVLLVAGGGGGGTSGGEGGGGGAGGVLWYSNSSIDGKTPNGSQRTFLADSYAITIGPGGSGATTYAPARDNTNGVDSTIVGSGLSLTAVGGGRGGGYPDQDVGEGNGGNGGSGGGGGGNYATGGQHFGGSGTVGQGNNGGDGVLQSASTYAGGGGGGAKTAGSDGWSTGIHKGGNGGAGYNFSSLAASIGLSGKVGGGGGGHGNSGAPGGDATDGGSTGNTGVNATVNSGGGGSAGLPSNGGSGVCVIRYQL